MKILAYGNPPRSDAKMVIDCNTCASKLEVEIADTEPELPGFRRFSCPVCGQRTIAFEGSFR